MLARRGGGSNPNAAVLAQIQKLSQQLVRLQFDLDSQFAHVNVLLITIMATLNQNFALINYQLGVLTSDLHAVQVSLLDVEAQINQLAVYTLAYSQAVSKETLIAQMNGCLNYAVIHNGADPGPSTYASCENALYTWGFYSALDELWAGTLQPDYSDGNIYNIFSDFPLSVLVNYLAQFTNQNLGLSALSAVRIPNPNEWLLAARAYLELAHQLPQYAAQISSSRLHDLIEAGTAYQRAAQNANSIRNGNTISANQPLFTAVANKYDAISSLQTALQGVVDTYLANPANGITNSSNGITLNLWVRGDDQVARWRPSVGSIQFCNGGGETLSPAPSSIFSFAPDTYAFAQGYLSSGTLTMCISNVQWINTVDPFTNPPAPGPGATWCYDRSFDIPPGEVFGYADDCQISELQITVSVRFNGTEILTASATSGPDMIVSWWSDSTWCSQSGACTDTSFSVDPNYAVQFLWTRSSNSSPYPFGHELSNLESSPTVVQQPQPQLLATAAADIDAVAAKHQQNIYGNISNAFGIVGPVQSAGQSLTAGKLLLQAFVIFGLPNSLQTNDTLHSHLTNILDGAAVQSDFLAFSTSAIPDTTDNKVTDEIAAMNARLANLNVTITGALNQVQQSQIPESLYSVDLMLDDLRAFEALKNAGALWP